MSSQTKALSDLRIKMITSLKNVAGDSSQTTCTWYGQGGEHFINVDVKIQHKNAHSATQYTVLTEKGDLFRRTANKGAFCSLDRLELETLANVYDHVFGFENS